MNSGLVSMPTPWAGDLTGNNPLITEQSQIFLEEGGGGDGLSIEAQGIKHGGGRSLGVLAVDQEADDGVRADVQRHGGTGGLPVGAGRVCGVVGLRGALGHDEFEPEGQLGGFPDVALFSDQAALQLFRRGYSGLDGTVGTLAGTTVCTGSVVAGGGHVQGDARPPGGEDALIDCSTDGHAMDGVRAGLFLGGKRRERKRQEEGVVAERGYVEVLHGVQAVMEGMVVRRMVTRPMVRPARRSWRVLRAQVRSPGGSALIQRLYMAIRMQVDRSQ